MSTTKDDIQFLQRVLHTIASGEAMHDFRSPEFRRVFELADRYGADSTSDDEVQYALISLGLSALAIIIDHHVRSMAAQRDACLALDAARGASPLQ